MSIKAIFYSKFDVEEGPKVIHQVPEDSIISSASDATSATSNTLVSFPAISRFVIPRQSLCGNILSLIPPTSPQSPLPCVVLSHPICLRSPHYQRNEFIFAFSIILSPPDAVDIPSYKSVLTKLTHLMRSLEEQSQFLSDDVSSPNTGKIYSLCEILMEDLNNYCECMIPIDEINTLNIKLFPTFPNPPAVKAWHVPLFTVRIDTLMDETWDLTMQRIIPFVNGVNSVKKISILADADLGLTRKCVRHLLYYGCLLLLDIFSFNAIYAPTAQFTKTIVSDPTTQRECARYVNLALALNAPPPLSPPSLRESHPASGNSQVPTQAADVFFADLDEYPRSATGSYLSGPTIVQLYTALRQGLTVREWYSLNASMLTNVDVRRFITFGVIKGFLYRVHRWATLAGSEASQNGNGQAGVQKNSLTNSVGVTRRDANGPRSSRLLPRSMSSELQLTVNNIDNDSSDEEVANSKLRKYLDGAHCFDQICTELGVSEKALLERFKKFPGEVVVIDR